LERFDTLGDFFAIGATNAASALREASELPAIRVLREAVVVLPEE
jgi:hypothetical protein